MSSLHSRLSDAQCAHIGQLEANIISSDVLPPDVKLSTAFTSLSILFPAEIDTVLSLLACGTFTLACGERPDLRPALDRVLESQTFEPLISWREFRILLCYYYRIAHISAYL